MISAPATDVDVDEELVLKGATVDDVDELATIVVEVATGAVVAVVLVEGDDDVEVVVAPAAVVVVDESGAVLVVDDGAVDVVVSGTDVDVSGTDELVVLAGDVVETPAVVVVDPAESSTTKSAAARSNAWDVGMPDDPGVRASTEPSRMYQIVLAGSDISATPMRASW
jgi:hypothetical protein